MGPVDSADRPTAGAPTFYQILGVSRSASGEEIRKAYLALAKKWHPDRAQNKAVAEQIFAEIQKAYFCLNHPSLRRQYDATLFGITITVGEKPKIPLIALGLVGGGIFWYFWSPAFLPARFPLQDSTNAWHTLTAFQWSALFLQKRFDQWLWNRHAPLVWEYLTFGGLVLFGVSRISLYGIKRIFFPVERRVIRGNILEGMTVTKETEEILRTGNLMEEYPPEGMPAEESTEKGKAQNASDLFTRIDRTKLVR